MRGEHQVYQFDSCAQAGSSPHARGTHTIFHHVVSEIGIIPACAGNTVSIAMVCRRNGDHPRMRGEHLAQTGKDANDQGSSPHARGTPRICD